MKKLIIMFIGFFLFHNVYSKTLNEEIVEKSLWIFNNIKHSNYSHNNFIDEANGEYQVDCSGLVAHITKELAPWAIESVWKEPEGFNRPRAIGFYWAILGEEWGWKLIRTIKNVKAGDILAWRKTKYKKWGNSGHIMIILEDPQEEKNGLWKCKVMDSTNYRFTHENDSRKDKEGGIGVGTIWIEVDEEGWPKGYWRNKRQRLVLPKIMVFGRLRIS